MATNWKSLLLLLLLITCQSQKLCLTSLTSLTRLTSMTSMTRLTSLISLTSLTSLTVLKTQGGAIWKTMAVTRCRTLFCPKGCLLASDNMELGSTL
jgi:hypothetical protein